MKAADFKPGTKVQWTDGHRVHVGLIVECPDMPKGLKGWVRVEEIVTAAIPHNLPPHREVDVVE